MRTPLIDRLLPKVQKTSSCWLWTGAKNGEYGVIGEGGKGGKMLYAHRASYELFVGPIPKGMTLDHLCRVRSCVNPEHLEPVSMRENTLRGVGPSAINATKTYCIHGHPFDEENTAVRKNGHRACRTCERQRRKGDKS